MANTQWRMNRIPGLEMAIFARGRIQFAEQYAAHDDQTAAAIMDAETFVVYQKQLRNLTTQEGRLRRQYQKCKGRGCAPPDGKVTRLPFGCARYRVRFARVPQKDLAELKQLQQARAEATKTTANLDQIGFEFANTAFSDSHASNTQPTASESELAHRQTA